MCLLGLLLNAGPNHSTTALLHLRDERLSRPTAPPAPSAAVVHSTDLQRSGTWFGWHPGSGLAAAVTNVRARLAHEPTTSSRGLLVLQLLDGSAAPALRFDALLASAAGSGGGGVVDLGDVYAPFNLVLLRLGSAGSASGSSSSSAAPGARAQALFLSNVQEAQGSGAGGAPLGVSCSAWVPGPGPGGRAARVVALSDGVHVVGNVPGVDDARWGKIALLQDGLQAAAAAAAEDAGAAAGDCASASAALVARLAAPFLRAEPLDPCQTDFAFSPHPPAVEAALQRHVLIPWGSPIEDYGSRTLSCLAARAGSAPCYAWRELSGGPEGEGGGGFSFIHGSAGAAAAPPAPTY